MAVRNSVWALNRRSKQYGSLASIYITPSFLEEPAGVLPHAEMREEKKKKTIRNIYLVRTVTRVASF